MKQGFGIWLTGLPASGKSSIAAGLLRALDARGAKTVVLESDEMRKILTPAPTYREDERDRFYRMLAELGALIARSGVNVVFDATANRRAYRDRARSLFSRFIEVHVDCPLEVCRERDPKGIYAKAAAGAADSVPGAQAPYEPPLTPEVVVDCRMPPDASVQVVISVIENAGGIA